MPELSQGRTILVVGATGKQGGAAARHLLERGFRVRALTRNPVTQAAAALRAAGAEVVKGDLDERATLDRALSGAYGCFSVQNFWETGYQREIDQGVRLTAAAKDAGVQHLVYSSVASAHRDTGLSHFESKWQIEEDLRGSGVPWTILRPVWFMENWEGEFLRPAILQGTLALPLSPHVNFQQISADDVGGFAALAFADPEGWMGRAVDLAGDEGSIASVVDRFSAVIGRPVSYEQVPWDQYRAAAGDEYHDMFRWFEDVGYDADVAARREEYPALTSFEHYLRGAGWEGARPPRPATPPSAAGPSS
jgi:uncharacterized protein YbjT (DUF2867 family)